MALLDAIRVLTSFAPPPSLPDADLALLGDVLEAHGLAPLASYQLEHTRLGAGVPEPFRERLLSSFQGVVNDNFLKLLSFRRAIRDADDVPLVLLDAAAYADWLYPHLAFRPIIDLRAAMRAEDAPRFAERVKGGGLRVVANEDDGHTVLFSDGTIDVRFQEGLFPGAPPDPLLFERSRPYRAFGACAARPSPEDALLSTIGGQALLGLLAPLVTFVDVRELLRLDLDAGYVRARAESLRLSRALYGSSLLAAHFFPEVAEAAAAIRPALGFAERAAVERVVEAAKDPAQLRHLRGADVAARLVVAP